MTDETGTRVAAELARAIPLKPAAVGVDREPAPAGRGVADRTVALGVAADARVEVALRFPCVVAGSASGEGRSDEVDRMKLVARDVGPAHRDPRALVAREAKLLLLVAARAARVVLARGDGAHRDPVIGVNAARPDFTVVAVGAVTLGVAAAAKSAVVGRNALVALDEVGRVLRVHEPARRLELARREEHLDAAVGLA